MHLVRDIIVAVVGGLVALVVGLSVTNATPTQQVWVYVAALAVCGLVLGAQQLPSLLKRRRDAFKAEVIAAARSQILAELDSRMSDPKQSISVDLADVGTLASSPQDEITKFAVLLEQGRMLQGALRSSDTSSTVLYGDEAAAIGQWEGRARAALVHREEYLREFANAEGFDGIGLSRGETYRRMSTQLAALEGAIRELEKSRQRQQSRLRPPQTWGSTTSHRCSGRLMPLVPVQTTLAYQSTLKTPQSRRRRCRWSSCHFRFGLNLRMNQSATSQETSFS